MSGYDVNVSQFHRRDSINSDDGHIYFTISDLNTSSPNQQQSDGDQTQQSESDWSKQRDACWQEYWRWCELNVIFICIRITNQLLYLEWIIVSLCHYRPNNQDKWYLHCSCYILYGININCCVLARFSLQWTKYYWCQSVGDGLRWWPEEMGTIWQFVWPEQSAHLPSSAK